MGIVDDLEQAKRIFDQAVDLPPAEQSALIEASCAPNTSVRHHVERMLEEFESDCARNDWPLAPVIDHAESQEEGRFTGTDRFKVRARLGSGAFGTVYEVFDQETKTTVALKLLEKCLPDSLFRFKREFRSLVHIRHENLVHLYELISDGGRWFFTMEMVDGVDFVEYARSQNTVCDYSRLRNALRQLIIAVDSLHSARQLHRDLKPANVLVTNAGRVVVLDFGLVKQLADGVSDQTATMVGTPAYMSPEQVAHLPVNEASDWYSVGVMLYQALTAQLPHASSLMDRWLNDRKETPVEPRALNSGVPKDLNDLCVQLLSKSPKHRPTGGQMLLALQEHGAAKPEIKSVDVESRDRVFRGRDYEISVLQSAFDDSIAGQLEVVLIEGKSQIGKTALVRHFLQVLQTGQPRMLSLVGRCYEFESVPYKGLDALIDELSQRLQKLSASTVEALLPKDAFLLPKLFPVLARVKAIETAPVLSSGPANSQELRLRAFSAFREMLARLASRQPVVIWIDDLQWSDRDSSLFLAKLCAPPFPPPLLLLLSYRTGQLDPETTLQYRRQTLSGRKKLLGNWRRLVLSALTER